MVTSIRICPLPQYFKPREWLWRVLFFTLVCALSTPIGLAAPLPSLLKDEVAIAPKRPFIVTGVCLSRDGKNIYLVGRTKVFAYEGKGAPELITTESDGYLINLDSRAISPFTNRHTEHIRNVAESPDRTTVYSLGGRDSEFTVRTWDTKNQVSQHLIDLSKYTHLPINFYGNELSILPKTGHLAICHSAGITCFHSDGRLANFDFTHHTLTEQSPAQITGMSRASSEYLACSTTRTQVLVWNSSTREIAYAPSVPTRSGSEGLNCVTAMEFDKSGTKLFVCRGGTIDPEIPVGVDEATVEAKDRSVVVVDIPKKEILHLGFGVLHRTSQLALHPNAEILAVAGFSRDQRGKIIQNGAGTAFELRIYQINTKKMLHQQFWTQFGPNWFQFTADGTKMVGVDQSTGTVYVWKLNQ
jgi:WD40 repeat protein